MLELGFAGFELSRDESTTCEAMLGQPGESRLSVMPTHHIDPLVRLVYLCAQFTRPTGTPCLPVCLVHGADTRMQGDMIGFRFDCAPFLPGSVLPLSRTMFHGHTLVECQAEEKDILRLMSEPEANRARMLEFLRGVEAECVPATLDCVPENSSASTSTGQVHAQVRGQSGTASKRV